MAVQTPPAALDMGRPVERALTCGDTHEYRLDVNLGDYVEIVAERRGADVVLAALPPGALAIAQIWRLPRLAGPSRLLFVSPGQGALTITARCPYSQTRSGRYVIRIEAHRAATDADRDRVAAERAFAEGQYTGLNAGQERVRKALTSYEEALRLWRRAGDERGEADALGGISLALYTLAETRKALDIGAQALAIHRRRGDRFGEASQVGAHGTFHFTLGEFDAALAHYEEATPIWREVGDPEGEAGNLHSRGVILQSRGDLGSALAAFEAALPVWRTLGNAVGEGSTLNAIAVLRANTAEYQLALDAYQGAIARFRDAGDGRSETVAVTNLGVVLDVLGDQESSLEHHQRALALSRTLGDQRAESTVLTNIGRSHLVNGRPALALPPLRDALSLRRTTANRFGEALTLCDLGMAHAALGDARQAAELLTEALTIQRSVKDRRGEALTLTGLAEARAALGSRDEARAHFKESVAISESIGYERRLVNTLTLFGRFERDAGNLGEARAHLERALARLETGRTRITAQEQRSGYLASTRTSYELYVDVLMRQHAREPAAGHDVTALTTSEQARARSLVEMLADAHAQIGPQADAQPLPARDLQRAVVDDGSVLLEYMLGDDRSYLWIVTPEAIASVELPGRAVIEAAARRVYDLLIASTRREARTQARLAAADLSRMILGPAADRLGTRRLLVVPDGALHYVPFAALPHPSAARAAADTSEPLIVRHEIVTLPSASALVVARRDLASRKTAPNAVAVVADPVLDRNDPRVRGRRVSEAAAPNPDVTRSAAEAGLERFERLPFSRQEADAIVRLAGSRGSLKAVDFEASRRTVTGARLAAYRVVHLATHGLLNSRHPERSGIVLSLVDERGAPQDGFLRLRDIYDLKLGADLVVLSACRTALGKDIRGEGLIGLTRGFMYAGARSVVASLWDVRDEATAELMTRFYRRLLKGGVGTAAALREAQLSMWREPRWQAPYFWSGFVLQGEWQ